MTPCALAMEAARRILAELADDGVSIGAAEYAADASRELHDAASDYDRAGRVLTHASELLLNEAGDGLDAAIVVALAELATGGDREAKARILAELGVTPATVLDPFLAEVFGIDADGRDP